MCLLENVEISDTLHGRARAWQGFYMLANWSLVFGDEGALRRLGRRLRGGSLTRVRQWL